MACFLLAASTASCGRNLTWGGEGQGSGISGSRWLSPFSDEHLQGMRCFVALLTSIYHKIPKQSSPHFADEEAGTQKSRLFLKLAMLERRSRLQGRSLDSGHKFNPLATFYPLFSHFLLVFILFVHLYILLLYISLTLDCSCF